MSARRVAVVGGGLGGLAAAGELALRGLEVTLFEATALGGKAGSLRADGLVLDTGPTLLAMPDTVRAAFERLGAADLLPPIREVDPQCEYLFADGSRFTAHRDLERTSESARAFGAHEAEGVRSFYREAAALYRVAAGPYLEATYEGVAGLLARMARRALGDFPRGLPRGSLHAMAQRHFRSQAMRQFVGRFATYAGASPYRASSVFALIPHLERAQGVHHVQGGIGALATAFAAAVARTGVRVELGARARWEPRGALFRVGPEGGEREFDALVVNADPLASLGRDRERLSLSGYVLLLEADQRLSLPHHSVLFGPDDRAEFDALFEGRLPASPTVYCCHPAASDPTMAPAGKSGLYVMVNAPALPRSGPAPDWATQSRHLRGLCLRALERAFPVLADVSLRVVGERTPEDFARLGAPGGSLYGFLPHGQLGAFRRPRLRGPVPGLFYAGGGTHPGGGVPLVLLSGHFAAGLAAEHLGAAS